MRKMNLAPFFRVSLILVASFASAAAQQTTASNASPQPAQPTVTYAAEGDNRYRIGPGDVLGIRILNRPNLSREAVRVEGNGMIRMPLIDSEIMAACKTEGELAKEDRKSVV